MGPRNLELLLDGERPKETSSKEGFERPFHFCSTITNWIGIEKVNENEYGTFSLEFLTAYFLAYDRLNRSLKGDKPPFKKIVFGPRIRRIFISTIPESNSIAFNELYRVLPRPVAQRPSGPLDPNIELLYQEASVFFKSLLLPKVFRDLTEEDLHHRAKLWLAKGYADFDKPSSYKPDLLWIYTKQTQSEILTMGLIMHRMGIYKDVRLLIFKWIGHVAD